MNFLEFADRLGREISGGEARLNTNDPDAVPKLLAHVDRQAADFEAATGQPRENSFRDLFDRTLGRGAGATGRGLLGAGRFVGETAQEIIPSGAVPDPTPLLQDPTGQPTELGATLDAAEAVAQTGGSIGIEGITRGVDPSLRVFGVEGTSFQDFADDLDRRRAEATLAESLTLQPSRDAFRHSDIPAPVRIGAELAFDPFNLIPGAALATRTGRVAVRGAQEAAESAVRQAPTTVRRIADDVLPVGRAAAAEGVDDAADQAAARAARDAIRTGDTSTFDEAAELARLEAEIQAVKQAAPTVVDDAADEIASSTLRTRELARIAGASRIDDELERQVAFRRLEIDLRDRAPTEAAITNLAAQVREARPLSNAQREALRSAERSRRVGQFAATLETGQGQEAFRRASSALAGELPNPRFETPTVSADDLLLLSERIRTLNIRPLAKQNTNTAFLRLLQGEIPRPFEIPLLERAFGREFVEAFAAGGAGAAARGRTGILIDILGIPKTIRSAFDLSFPFRQGLLLSARNPREFAASFRAMFGSFSPRIAREINEEIFADPDIQLLRENGLFLQPVEGITPAARIAAREETFVSRFASRIPGVRISERTFGTFGNKLRSDIAKKTLNNWRAQGIDINDPERLQSLSNFINIFTGRGNLGQAEGIANALQIGFWSPRLLVSRFQAPLLLRDPVARRIVAENLAATFGVGMSVLALVKASGLGDVETDPRSSDFGKIRIGRTRVDFWGGFQQIFRYMAQVTSGKVKSTRSGEVFSLSDFDSNRAELLGRFARSKVSPGLPTILANELFGESFLGEELGERPDRGRPPRQIEAPLESANIDTVREQEAVLQLAPLFAVELVDAMEEHGIVNGTGVAVPALFGVSTSTFNEPREELEGRDLVPEPTTR